MKTKAKIRKPTTNARKRRDYMMGVINQNIAKGLELAFTASFYAACAHHWQPRPNLMTVWLDAVEAQLKEYEANAPAKRTNTRKAVRS